MDQLARALALRNARTIKALHDGYKLKGTVEYYADLPQSGNTVGDGYVVQNADEEGHKSGPYIWGYQNDVLVWYYFGGTNTISPAELYALLEDGDKIDVSFDSDSSKIKIDFNDAANEEISGKQNIITDLNDIRNGASKGATAVQDDDYANEKVIWNNYATTKQDTLVSGTNIKTVNGNSLLGSGNVDVKTYQPYSSSWGGSSSTITVADFCSAIIADSNVTVGMAYSGTIASSAFFTGISGLSRAEVNVQVMGDSSSKVLLLTCTSADVEPYHWELTYYSGTSSGWRALGGSSATWGQINGTLSNQVDLQTALSGKQDVLSAGNNISITNNVISANVTLGYEEVE